MGKCIYHICGLTNALINTFFLQTVVKKLGLEPDVAENFALFDIEEYNFGKKHFNTGCQRIKKGKIGRYVMLCYDYVIWAR